jgi:hypothetical protein
MIDLAFGNLFQTDIWTDTIQFPCIFVVERNTVSDKILRDIGSEVIDLQDEENISFIVTQMDISNPIWKIVYIGYSRISVFCHVQLRSSSGRT